MFICWLMFLYFVDLFLYWWFLSVIIWSTSIFHL